MKTALIPIAPVRPVAAYIGGKRILAKRLGELISNIDHQLYVEPFVGMGGVFFRRAHRPSVEVINDISRDVATLFRLLQRHYQQFLDVLKWQLASRSEFERLLRQDANTLTDLERGARFLYLQRLAFGGKVRGQAFGISTTGGARFDLTKLVPLLEDVHERLSGVVIESLPYQDLIPRYDRAHALFYLDPPYWGSTDDYGRGVFSEDDFGALRSLLDGIKGHFIMSINDVPQIRSIFAGYAMQSVELNYSISGSATAARELIVTNAPLF